jgi:phytoene dehydrogenase-like protein
VTRVAVVGAGVAGLACAARLAADVRVSVLDRIPVPGGVHGWQAPETTALERAARAAGAELHLGVTATRWQGGVLTAVGPEGVRRIPAAALVIAAGTRPRTRAELGLAGDRPAGVVAAPVACHLAENGLLVGRHPCVVGGGDWAARACARLLDAGARTATVVAPAGALRQLPAAARVLEGIEPTAIEGGARVSLLHAGTDRVECDAVVLAHGLVPLRNVDGAVWDGAATVYVQPAEDPGSVAGARAAGEQAATGVLELVAKAAAA